jgi:CheY-like chemotaxis protein
MIPKIASLKDLELIEKTLGGILGFQIQALIYDSNIASRRILEAVFTPGPLIPAKVFSSGKELLKSIEEDHLPTVVFYDLGCKKLPLEIFLASLKKMRESKANKIWVIATVQMMDKQRLMELVPLGLSGLLTTPLHPDVVKEKLAEMCHFPTKMEMSQIKETIEKWKMS